MNPQIQIWAQNKQNWFSLKNWTKHRNEDFRFWIQIRCRPPKFQFLSWNKQRGFNLVRIKNLIQYFKSATKETSIAVFSQFFKSNQFWSEFKLFWPRKAGFKIKRKNSIKISQEDLNQRDSAKMGFFFQYRTSKLEPFSTFKGQFRMKKKFIEILGFEYYIIFLMISKMSNWALGLPCVFGD